ncbi:MAG: heat-inducible transcription repressor HrcA [Deltaproteobacteria bacterium]|nr:heat-inducible transcription repressor HrcA [Deltaproteobacteria bacterium]
MVQKENTELSVRDRAVLRAVVERYVAEAQPVASGVISQLAIAKERVSPATIRNTMARLEALGYLEAPHTSAGRVPTKKGMQLYLDALMPRRHLSDRDTLRIETELSPALPHESPWSNASKSLSAVAEQLALCMSPRFVHTIFDHIEFVQVGSRRLVAICVSSTGSVFHRIVELEADLPASQLERINAIMREAFCGLTLMEIRARIASELSQERARADAMYRRALELSVRGVPSPDDSELSVDGTGQLVLNMRVDSVQLRHLLQAIEEKSILLRLLGRVPADGSRVTFGADLGERSLEGFALVTAPYIAPGGETGVIGILGPMHMDYARLVPIVQFSATTMTKHLRGGG